jgi:hypothetical protein
MTSGSPSVLVSHVSWAGLSAGRLWWRRGGRARSLCIDKYRKVITSLGSYYYGGREAGGGREHMSKGKRLTITCWTSVVCEQQYHKTGGIRYLGYEFPFSDSVRLGM